MIQQGTSTTAKQEHGWKLGRLVVLWARPEQPGQREGQVQQELPEILVRRARQAQQVLREQREARDLQGPLAGRVRWVPPVRRGQPVPLAELVQLVLLAVLDRPDQQVQLEAQGQRE